MATGKVELDLSWLEKKVIQWTYSKFPGITKTIWVFNQWRRGVKRINLKQINNNDKREIGKYNKLFHLGMPLKYPGKRRKVRIGATCK